MSFPACLRCSTRGWQLSRCYSLDVDLAELEEREPTIAAAAAKLATFEVRLRGKLDA